MVRVNPDKTYELVFWTYNIFFTLTGLAVLITGIWAIASYPGHVSDISDGVKGYGVFSVFVGLFTIGVGALGAVATLQKNDHLKGYYGVMTKIAIGVTLLAAVFSGANVNVEGDVHDTWINGLTTIYSMDESLRFTWADRHRELDCCGVDGPGDFFNNTATGYYVPRSCCDGEGDEMYQVCKKEGQTNSETKYLRTQGCYTLWVDMVESYNQVLTWTTLTAVCIQIFGLIMSWLMISSAASNARKSFLPQ